MTNYFIWFDLKFAAVLEVLTFLCCDMTVVMMCSGIFFIE